MCSDRDTSTSSTGHGRSPCFVDQGIEIIVRVPSPSGEARVTTRGEGYATTEDGDMLLPLLPGSFVYSLAQVEGGCGTLYQVAPESCHPLPPAATRLLCLGCSARLLCLTPPDWLLQIGSLDPTSCTPASDWALWHAPNLIAITMCTARAT